MSQKALYAGSFDPITKGHLDIIERAANMFDSLTVGVIVNQSKHSLFTLEERLDIVRNVTRDLDNVNVESFDGLLADYVNQNNFNAVIRGLRSNTDFDYEIQMAQMNAKLFHNNAETVFLMTRPELSFISSSLVKEVASLGGDIDGLLPEYAEQLVLKKVSSKQ